VLLKIVQAGDPVLRTPARPLTAAELESREVAALVALMRDTMRDAPGVGLAAPQIGESLQLAVIEVRAEYLNRLPPEEIAAREMAPVAFHVIANPVLEVVDPEWLSFPEGCLSLPGFGARVARARAVRVRALNERGAPVEIHARGWYARILQHEIDHLRGALYIDRMDARSFATRENAERYGTSASASNAHESSQEPGGGEDDGE